MKSKLISSFFTLALLTISFGLLSQFSEQGAFAQDIHDQTRVVLSCGSASGINLAITAAHLKNFDPGSKQIGSGNLQWYSGAVTFLDKTVKPLSCFRPYLAPSGVEILKGTARYICFSELPYIPMKLVNSNPSYYTEDTDLIETLKTNRPQYLVSYKADHQSLMLFSGDGKIPLQTNDQSCIANGF